MNDKPGVVFSRLNLGDDPIERNNFSLHVRVEDLQCEISRGQGAGNGDADAARSAGSILRLETTMGP